LRSRKAAEAEHRAIQVPSNGRPSFAALGGTHGAGGLLVTYCRDVHGWDWGRFDWVDSWGGR
jgi:hypothetical protein